MMKCPDLRHSFTLFFCSLVYSTIFSFRLMQSVQKRYHSRKLEIECKKATKKSCCSPCPKDFFQIYIHTYINVFIYSSVELQK